MRENGSGWCRSSKSAAKDKAGDERKAASELVSDSGFAVF